MPAATIVSAGGAGVSGGDEASGAAGRRPTVKVLVGGGFISVGGTTHNCIACLTSGDTPGFFAGAMAVSGDQWVRIP